MKTYIRLAVIGLALGLAACNSDGTTGTVDQNNPLVLDRDVAQATGEEAGHDVEIMGGPGGDLGMGLEGVIEGAVPHCDQRQGDGLRVTRTCVFKSAGGDVQAAFDANTTASVTIHTETNGEVKRDRWTATVHRVRDLVVSGLAGNEQTRTWDGTGTTTIVRSRHGDGDGARTYDITETVKIEHVVVPAQRTDRSWPLSGSITHHITIKVIGGPKDGQTFERTVTITFNGTRIVDLVVNGKTFKLDLKTRKIMNEGD